MNHSDLNITSYEIYDRMGCVLCGMKTLFTRTFWPEFEGKGPLGWPKGFYKKVLMKPLGRPKGLLGRPKGSEHNQ